MTKAAETFRKRKLKQFQDNVKLTETQRSLVAAGVAAAGSTAAVVPLHVLDVARSADVFDPTIPGPKWHQFKNLKTWKKAYQTVPGKWMKLVPAQMLTFAGYDGLKRYLDKNHAKPIPKLTKTAAPAALLALPKLFSKIPKLLNFGTKTKQFTQGMGVAPGGNLKEMFTTKPGLLGIGTSAGIFSLNSKLGDPKKMVTPLAKDLLK